MTLPAAVQPPAGPVLGPRSAFPLLKYWLADNDITQAEFAERWDFFKQEVSLWCLPWGNPRRAIPTAEKLARLKEATGGAAGIEWFTPPELRAGAPAGQDYAPAHPRVEPEGDGAEPETSRDPLTFTQPETSR